MHEACPLRADVVDLTGAAVAHARVQLRRRRPYVEGMPVPAITAEAEADPGGVLRVDLPPGEYIVTVTQPCGRHARAFLAHAPGAWLRHAV